MAGSSSVAALFPVARWRRSTAYGVVWSRRSDGAGPLLTPDRALRSDGGDEHEVAQAQGDAKPWLSFRVFLELHCLAAAAASPCPCPLVAPHPRPIPHHDGAGGRRASGHRAGAAEDPREPSNSTSPPILLLSLPFSCNSIFAIIFWGHEYSFIVQSSFYGNGPTGSDL